ncbi:hypothetical protein GA0061094_1244 [[Bacillus] enclensis]|uniref:Uncharacterized protein n=1 Tax=[Bacillus] enclensis TaxID=1402860 RepID=A0A1C4A535_9BACI|nr:hypothetical protein GA0061094_1244 [[Bacillus] enclensis]
MSSTIALPIETFSPPNEVKERLHKTALQRLSVLNKALPLFLFIHRLQIFFIFYRFGKEDK